MTARRVVNLCFHGIGTIDHEREPGESRYWVGRDTFRSVLDLVVDRPDVALSFDDGNASDVAVALPELVDRGLTATFFPVAARLDTPGNLASSDVAALAEAGMDVGSHGMLHRSWRRLDPAGRAAEFDEARAILAEAARRPVLVAACPLGAYDRRVLLELRRRGYRRVMTSDRATARPTAWLQPRFSVRAEDSVGDVRRLLARPDTLLGRRSAAARTVVKALR